MHMENGDFPRKQKRGKRKRKRSPFVQLASLEGKRIYIKKSRKKMGPAIAKGRKGERTVCLIMSACDWSRITKSIPPPRILKEKRKKRVKKLK